MEKFEFIVEREVTSWVKDVYEIEAESLEEAESLLEDNDFEISSMKEAVKVSEFLDSDRNYDCAWRPQRTIITNEDGDEIFDDTL